MAVIYALDRRRPHHNSRLLAREVNDKIFSKQSVMTPEPEEGATKMTVYDSTHGIMLDDAKIVVFAKAQIRGDRKRIAAALYSTRRRF